jgi:membrane fusion protein (multidrug efflux system)
VARKNNQVIRRGLLKTAALGILSLVVAACGGSGTAKEEGGEGASRDALTGTTQDEKVNVSVEELKARPFSSRLLLVGEVRAENDAVISSQAAGTVRRVVSDRGSRVQRGDTLLILDSRRYQAAYNAAAAQASNMRLDYEMAEKLHKSGQGVSDNDFTKAANGLKMTEAALANALIDLENCFITATQSGTVAERFVDVGELVAPGVPLLQLVQGDIKVRCGLPEHQSSSVQRGTKAIVRIAEAGIEVSATVDWVGYVLDDRSRTLPIELKLAKSPDLRPGMACQVELDRPHGAQSIVVPVTVIQTAPESVYVFVETAGKAVRRNVTLGERSGDKVEVLTGLSAGDRLIVSGYRGLSDGQSLAVIDPAKKTVETVQAPATEASQDGGR